jgi:hypothetical protein
MLLELHFKILVMVHFCDFVSVVFASQFSNLIAVFVSFLVCLQSALLFFFFFFFFFFSLSLSLVSVVIGSGGWAIQWIIHILEYMDLQTIKRVRFAQLSVCLFSTRPPPSSIFGLAQVNLLRLFSVFHQVFNFGLDHWRLKENNVTEFLHKMLWKSDLIDGIDNAAHDMTVHAALDLACKLVGAFPRTVYLSFSGERAPPRYPTLHASTSIIASCLNFLTTYMPSRLTLRSGWFGSAPATPTALPTSPIQPRIFTSTVDVSHVPQHAVPIVASPVLVSSSPSAATSGPSLKSRVLSNNNEEPRLSCCSRILARVRAMFSPAVVPLPSSSATPLPHPHRNLGWFMRHVGLSTLEQIRTQFNYSSLKPHPDFDLSDWTGDSNRRGDGLCEAHTQTHPHVGIDHKTDTVGPVPCLPLPLEWANEFSSLFDSNISLPTSAPPTHVERASIPAGTVPIEQRVPVAARAIESKCSCIHVCVCVCLSTFTRCTLQVCGTTCNYQLIIYQSCPFPKMPKFNSNSLPGCFVC